MFKCCYIMTGLCLQLRVLPLRVALCPVLKPSRAHSFCCSCEVFFSVFLIIHQTLSPQTEKRFGDFLDMCSDWTQVLSSSPHSGSHHLNPPAERRSLTGGCPWEVGVSVASWPSASDLNRFRSLAGCFHVFIQTLCHLYIYYWLLI